VSSDIVTLWAVLVFIQPVLAGLDLRPIYHRLEHRCPPRLPASIPITGGRGHRPSLRTRRGSRSTKPWAHDWTRPPARTASSQVIVELLETDSKRSVTASSRRRVVWRVADSAVTAVVSCR
jgi:hypothetical protein